MAFIIQPIMSSTAWVTFAVFKAVIGPKSIRSPWRTEVPATGWAKRCRRRSSRSTTPIWSSGWWTGYLHSAGATWRSLRQAERTSRSGWWTAPWVDTCACTQNRSCCSIIKSGYPAPVAFKKPSVEEVIYMPHCFVFKCFFCCFYT